MSLRQARDAGIRPNFDEEAPTMEQPNEVAPVDLLVLTSCDVDADGNVLSQRATFIAAGDPIPSSIAHLPRVDRETGDRLH